MAYAVQADLNLSTERLIELTDNPAAPGVIDSAVMTKTEVEAESIIDAALTGVVTVPFSAPIPPIIVTICAWIWAYRLYRHRPEMEIPKPIVDDYEMAMDMLKNLAARPQVLTGVSGDGSPAVESSEPRGWTPRDLVS